MVGVRRIAFRLMPLALLGVISCVGSPTQDLSDTEQVVDGKLTSSIKVTTVPASMAQPRKPSYQPILPNFSPRPKPSPTDTTTTNTGGTTTGGTTTGGTTTGGTTTGGTTGGTTTGGTTNTGGPGSQSTTTIYDAAGWTADFLAGARAGTAKDGTYINAYIGAVTPEQSGLALVGNSLYFVDKSNGALRMADITNKAVTTPAGTGSTNFGLKPTGLAYDSDRKVLYIADADKHVIRRVALTGNTLGLAADTVDVIAGISGTNTPYREGKGISAVDSEKAVLNAPMGLCYFANKLYFADSGNNNIRMIDLSQPTTMPVTLLAGSSTGASGKPADATIAEDNATTKFNSPHGLAIGVVAQHQCLLVADMNNHCIRAIRLDATTGSVSVLAGATMAAGTKDGTPADAQFNKPVSLAVDDNNMVYVGEVGNFRIRRVQATNNPTTVRTISGIDKAGNGTGPKDAAGYQSVVGLLVTGSGKHVVYAYDIGLPPAQGVTGDQPGPSIRVVTEQ